MVFCAYLAFCVVAMFTLLLAVVLDDAQLGATVVVAVVIGAGLRWVVTRQRGHRYPGPR